MRMWMVDPRGMCRQHLLGEHSELHKFAPGWAKGCGLGGYVKSNCIEPESYARRHDELVAEMHSRGYTHRTPLAQPDFSYLLKEHREAVVDREASLRELLTRCPRCRERFENI